MAIATVGEVAAFLDLPASPTGAAGQHIALALAASIEAVKLATVPRLWELVTDATEATSRTYSGGATHLAISDVVTTDDITVEESSDLATWTELTATAWHLEPFNGDPGPPELWRHGTSFARWVKVTGKHGVTAYPAALRDAVIMYAARLYERRNSPTGVTYGGDFGPIRISRAEDPDVARLLDTLTVPTIA